MKLDAKLDLIADILDVSANDLNLSDSLESYENWDSMASLMLISTLEENFSRTDIEGTQITNMKTIQDIVNVMEHANE